MVRILHAADFHLDSAFTGLNEQQARQRRQESRDLTRRMVDVSQDVIIREQDCGVTHGIKVSRISENGQVIEKFSDRVRGRYLVGDVVDAETGEVLIPNTKMMMEDDAALMEEHRFVYENTFSADNSMYFSFKMLDIELYTDVKNPELENQIEEVLKRHEIYYTKSEVWIESERLYEVLYETEV